MNDQQVLLGVIAELTKVTQELHTAQCVQRSAYLVLVRQMSRLDLVQADALAADLELMADVQTDADVRDGQRQLAADLRLACAGP